MEQNKLKRFERILQKCFLVIVMIIFIFAIGNSCESCSATQNKQIEYQDNNGIYYAKSDIINDSINMRTPLIIRNELIDEVEKYINTKTNKYHQSIPNYIVLAGLENNIDICFMMAQTQIETCYGTLGAGREKSRRSLFGVACHKYNNYENAINHYCEILQRYYLKNGKTEQHLMDRYVTINGARYASSLNYEREIKIAYNHIKKHTNIYNLQQEYKNMS